MSDVYVDNADDGPAEGGQAEGGVAETEERLFLPIDEYRDHLVPVKIDGLEEFVPLEEARAGFQRQADYTRKTQEIAQQRNDLGWAAAMKAALDQDPQGTIALLQTHYGVQQHSNVPQPTTQADPYDDWMSNDEGWQQTSQDPRVVALEQRLARIEQVEQEQKLRGDIARLQAAYPDFNPVDVVAHAVRLGSADLEAVYKQVTFDKMSHERSRFQQQLAAMEAQRQNKQQASFVSGGSSASSVSTEQVGQITSLRDAWQAAKRQLSQ